MVYYEIFRINLIFHILKQSNLKWNIVKYVNLNEFLNKINNMIYSKINRKGQMKMIPNDIILNLKIIAPKIEVNK